MTHQRLERIKNDERLVLSFYFVSLVLNVVIFVYNGSKQSHILQTMPNCLLQIYFFLRNLIYVYLKSSILRCMSRDLGMSLPLCQSHWFALIFALILPGTYSSSPKENWKFYRKGRIFLPYEEHLRRSDFDDSDLFQS